MISWLCSFNIWRSVQDISGISMAMLVDYLTSEYLRTYKNSHPPSISSTSTLISLGNWVPSSSWNLICKSAIYLQRLWSAGSFIFTWMLSTNANFTLLKPTCNRQLQHEQVCVVIVFLVKNKTKIADQWWTQSPHSKRGKGMFRSVYSSPCVFSRRLSSWALWCLTLYNMISWWWMTVFSYNRQSDRFLIIGFK